MQAVYEMKTGQIHAPSPIDKVVIPKCHVCDTGMTIWRSQGDKKFCSEDCETQNMTLDDDEEYKDYRHC